jgi:hypothetical protein
MEPGSIIFTEGFSLQDAMSVLEVHQFVLALQSFAHLLRTAGPVDWRTEAG